MVRQRRGNPCGCPVYGFAGIFDGGIGNRVVVAGTGNRVVLEAMGNNVVFGMGNHVVAGMEP